jgi:uncharacterized protein HemX
MVAPIIIAAAVSAAAGLMQQMQQQQQAKEEAERALAIQRERESHAQLQDAQKQQLGQINGMGRGEQDAIGQMMAALQRTAR